MFTEANLFTEVNEMIQSALESSGAAPASWIAHSVISRHDRISGEDVDFYTLCAHEHVRDTVRKAFRRFKPDAEDASDPQLTLPGFKRLQKAYLVTREADQIAVRVDLLTDAEIEQKADEYDAMAEGCRHHANELRRYAADRKRIAA